jgi:hypothetical protein
MSKFNRRRFLTTSAGLSAIALSPYSWAIERKKTQKIQVRFETYAPGKTVGKVMSITPHDHHFVHTYYDICPFSRSQRFIAATRLSIHDRIPILGDTADVCVIDLHEQTIETVYTTKSWGYQTGANLHWGASDRMLYTNDVIDGIAVCVGIDLESGKTLAYAGPMYDIAPDESCVIGFPFELLDITQPGYGVPAKDPKNPKKLPPGAATDEGIWRTDLRTNHKTLLVSLAETASLIPEPPPQSNGTFYYWHSKFNKQGTRIMQVLRCLFPDGSGGRNVNVFTYDSGGKNIHRTQSYPIWGHGGGHPNWHPDGKHLLRNLKPDGKRDRLCMIPYDGSDFTVLSETIDGGGHPTIEPNGRYIITDAFPHDGKQYVKIRLIDLTNQCEETICRIPTIDRETLKEMVMRLDGHPAWSHDYKKVVFQAAPEGKRQLFLADLNGVI